MEKVSNETIIAVLQERFEHLDEKLERIEKQTNEKLERIEAQTIKTNGRVNVNEDEISGIHTWISNINVSKWWIISTATLAGIIIGWFIEYISNRP
jgi:F0F1-type ATP synthase assembly protein I